MEDLLKMLPEQVTNDILKKNFKCIELESGNYSIDIHDLKNNKVETVDGLNNMETQIMLLSASSALWKLAKDKNLTKQFTSLFLKWMEHLENIFRTTFLISLVSIAG